MATTVVVVAIGLAGGGTLPGFGTPGSSAVPGAVDGIRIGEPAPPITGTTLDGTPFDLADLRGKPVLVNFWGPSCVPCREEFPLFKQMLAEHAQDGLAIVGVLFLDDAPSAERFAADYGATWPTVVDPEKTAATAYRVVARPQSYFIDANGILRSIQVGGMNRDDFERQLAALQSK